MSPPQGRFVAYRNALNSLSARTKTPFPSLILSFGILHELTAVAPLIGVFYGSRTLGIGDGIVSAIISADVNNSSATDKYFRGVFRNWVEEGDAWAGRVGRRYGMFGYEKTTPGVPDAHNETLQPSSHIASDVANAIVAYGVTKALLPVRIGFSLYLSPAFSRRVIEPIRKTVVQVFHRKSR